MQSIDETIPTTRNEIEAKIEKIQDARYELTSESTNAGFVRLNGIIRQLSYLKKLLAKLEQAKLEAK